MMPAAYKNREEIRAYYETHDTTLKEISEKYGVSYRTLTRWRVAGDWRAKRAIEQVQVEVIRDDLSKQGLNTFLGAKKQEIKQAIRENLKDIDVEPGVLECITEASSEDILLRAMSLHFINKNMLLAAIIARDELLKMLEDAESKKGSALIIAAAEKVAKMFSELKISLYGKESLLPTQSAQQNDYSKMTTQELLAIANEKDEDST
ncbi:DUF1804 family protein [Helicobacter felis]|uniref:DUF1804 family protein n=1 Tax=Helicobacter felis TaxID=214 RepID=UPI001F29958C|nr:DUF1804 family protein [Helicobacter felis]